MNFRAIHRPVDFENRPKGEESVVIICIISTDPELTPTAVFVREDGTTGSDYLSRFIITDGAWPRGE